MFIVEGISLPKNLYPMSPNAQVYSCRFV